jgi:hypothetical protein
VAGTGKECVGAIASSKRIGAGVGAKAVSAASEAAIVVEITVERKKWEGAELDDHVGEMTEVIDTMQTGSALGLWAKVREK